MHASLRRQGSPQVVAHRGSSHSNAEHTLGAYVAALDEGADALECDVRLTADGHLVCVHDRRVDRVARVPGTVSTMQLADLNQLDFASWKNPWAELDDETPEIDADKRRVLTLQRLLETAADYERPVGIAVETKHPTRYGGLVERRLVEILTPMGWAGRGSPVRVMSFSMMALGRLRRLAPDLETVLLLDSPSAYPRAYPWQMATRLLGADWIAGPGIALLRENLRLGRRLRDQGRRVHVWTVNSPADLELCLELGVDAVITDNPVTTLAYLGRGV
jgi:glycerophosphoryl diester phosphodiesterase